MRRGAAFSLAALLALLPVVAGSHAAPSRVVDESPTFIERFWDGSDLPRFPHRPVWELRYAVGGSGTPVSVYVAPQSGGAVETRWHFQAHLVTEAATFDASTRRLAGSDAHAFHWISPGEMASGRARIAHEEGELVHATPHVLVFGTPTGLYAYARVGGILLWAQGAEGTTLLLTSLVPHERLPPVEPGVLVVPASEEDAGAERRIPCGGVIASPLGGSQRCRTPFTAARSARVVLTTPSFPDLSEGEMSVTLQMAGEAPYHGTRCAGRKVGILSAMEACAPGDAPFLGPNGPGAHEAQGAASFTSCLNPTAHFKCVWDVTYKIQDD